MNFDEVFLVSTDLARVSQADIDRAEGELGVTLPAGYRTFIMRFGEGDYCDSIRIAGPDRLVKQTASLRDIWRESWYYGDNLDANNPRVLTQAQAAQSVNLGSTIDSDYFMFYPPRPDRIYVLPRHDDTITTLQADFSDLHDWDLPEAQRFLSFQSYKNLTTLEVIAQHPDFDLNELVARFQAQWPDSPSHLTIAEADEAVILFLQAIGARVQMVRYAAKGEQSSPRVRLQIAHVSSASEAIDAFLRTWGDPGLDKAIEEARAKHAKQR